MALINNKWQVVIGLEVHAQVISKTKLFSWAPVTFGEMPNTAVDFLDAGMPGSLPVLNSFCVDQAIKTGLSIHGQINEISAFDRKNYFYPDLSTGYQISQFYHPIVEDGYMDIELDDKVKRIRIQRIHLEQDAGKSIHDINPKCSYIDYNRAGTGLMELVTHPDLSSPEEAAEFVRKLQILFRYIKTCDANMEQGSMRVDANISLHIPGEPLGTRCEIKNLNSMRFLKQALEYEIERQAALLDSGQKVSQETRLFNTTTGKTATMRSKENAEDYRYFPDPDLPTVQVTKQRIEALQLQLPELPDHKKKRYMDTLFLSAYDADVLTSEIEIAKYFESGLQPQEGFSKLFANWIISELFSVLNKESRTIIDSKIHADDLAHMVLRIIDGTISGKIAKTVFEEMWNTGEKPDIIIDKKGLVQISDSHVIALAVDKIIADNPKEVEAYKGGKDKLFGFFVGNVLKHFQGKANPEVVNQILKEKLS